MKKILTNAEKYIGGILFALIIALCFAEVIYRFVTHGSAGWIEEYEIFLFIWFVYLGSSACVAEGKHVCVEMLVEKYPPILKLISSLLCTAIWLVVCVIVFKESLTVVSLNMAQGATTILAGLPYWIGQTAVPVGMVLMILRLVLQVPKAVQTYRESKLEKGGDH